MSKTQRHHVVTHNKEGKEGDNLKPQQGVHSILINVLLEKSSTLKEEATENKKRLQSLAATNTSPFLIQCSIG